MSEKESPSPETPRPEVPSEFPNDSRPDGVYVEAIFGCDVETTVREGSVIRQRALTAKPWWNGE